MLFSTVVLPTSLLMLSLASRIKTDQLAQFWTVTQSCRLVETTLVEPSPDRDQVKNNKTMWLLLN